MPSRDSWNRHVLDIWLKPNEIQFLSADLPRNEQSLFHQLPQSRRWNLLRTKWNQTRKTGHAKSRFFALKFQMRVSDSCIQVVTRGHQSGDLIFKPLLTFCFNQLSTSTFNVLSIESRNETSFSSVGRVSEAIVNALSFVFGNRLTQQSSANSSVNRFTFIICYSFFVSMFWFRQDIQTQASFMYVHTEVAANTCVLIWDNQPKRISILAPNN